MGMERQAQPCPKEHECSLVLPISTGESLGVLSYEKHD